MSLDKWLYVKLEEPLYDRFFAFWRQLHELTDDLLYLFRRRFEKPSANLWRDVKPHSKPPHLRPRWSDDNSSLVMRTELESFHKNPSPMLEAGHVLLATMRNAAQYHHLPPMWHHPMSEPLVMSDKRPSALGSKSAPSPSEMTACESMPEHPSSRGMPSGPHTCSPSEATEMSAHLWMPFGKSFDWLRQPAPTHAMTPPGHPFLQHPPPAMWTYPPFEMCPRTRTAIKTLHKARGQVTTFCKSPRRPRNSSLALKGLPVKPPYQPLCQLPLLARR
jgi:hypothetical protein